MPDFLALCFAAKIPSIVIWTFSTTSPFHPCAAELAVQIRHNALHCVHMYIVGHGVMYITIDTSALIAVIGNEKSKEEIVGLTTGYSLYAPASVHWEIGNAFSAMFKRGRSSIAAAKQAVDAYQEIPVRFIDVPLEQSLELSHRLNIYAYDAYLIQCALQTNTSLLTLDKDLVIAAMQSGIDCLEVSR